MFSGRTNAYEFTYKMRGPLPDGCIAVILIINCIDRFQYPYADEWLPQTEGDDQSDYSPLEEPE